LGATGDLLSIDSRCVYEFLLLQFAQRNLRFWISFVCKCSGRLFQRNRNDSMPVCAWVCVAYFGGKSDERQV